MIWICSFPIEISNFGDFYLHYKELSSSEYRVSISALCRLINVCIPIRKMATPDQRRDNRSFHLSSHSQLIHSRFMFSFKSLERLSSLFKYDRNWFNCRDDKMREFIQCFDSVLLVVAIEIKWPDDPPTVLMEITLDIQFLTSVLRVWIFSCGNKSLGLIQLKNKSRNSVKILYFNLVCLVSMFSVSEYLRLFPSFNDHRSSFPSSSKQRQRKEVLSGGPHTLA